ncbi:YdeI/OmpD-associated family protein [Occallatibacter savannae]|uniref:YdeI/OmpD-associated family protein n=1 Tax=Occallatibacter savannae TaxID=1002691 RepID=UPI000D69761A|nr:YdeI/OmpD-associated family protein [Occallatibacter savannae]
MRTLEQLPRVEIRSVGSWRKWLNTHAESSTGIWLVTFKKSARPDLYLSYDEIVDQAICFGWVDSLPRSLDEQRSMRLLSPRKKGSSWSKVNKHRAERLIAQGVMTPRGLAIINEAKRDGSWSRLDNVESLKLPPDLVQALASHSNATSNFDAFPRSTKRAILEWIQNAKKPETRNRRIEETAKAAAKNIRANQYRQ